VRRLVAALALGALGAIEGQFRRLIIGPVGGEAILGVGPPYGATLNTAVNDGKALGLHSLSLKPRS